ncbi:methyltransferase [Streptosporangiaceae bacterium NEAU-GS5]|nr:methyltransferase [Streptosporangiaceae bacterium NEAU-GS5]
MCCGSGALGVALAVRVRQAGRRAELYATDLDPVAVRCARRNVEPAGGQVFQGDLYAPLPASLRGRVDILLANVPYVPSEEVALLPSEARIHEPLIALDGGCDGLDVLRRVAAEASEWLAPGGWLLSETSERQAPTAARVLADAGLVPTVVSSDELYATVVIGRSGMKKP